MSICNKIRAEIVAAPASMSHAEMARKWQCSEAFVWKLRAQHGIRKNRRGIDKTQMERARQMRREGAKLAEIRLVCKVRHSTLSGWLKGAGLTTKRAPAVKKQPAAWVTKALSEMNAAK
jgi:hypothetical protein